MLVGVALVGSIAWSVRVGGVALVVATWLIVHRRRLAAAAIEKMMQKLSAELRAANARLQGEMNHRARIEVELRHAQKLEAVGRLAAGVAHELNTPLQFVSDSCSFVDEATRDVFELIREAGEILGRVRDGSLAPADGPTAFAAAADALSLDYLVERMPLATTRALEGLERIAAIVRSMKAFSDPTQDRAAADINRGIETTLTIARNEYKYVADVATELGELPMVECQIDELNQVFLNIIVNAAHAIEASSHGERGLIKIRTWVDGSDVKIAISDTGAGIPAAIRDKVFEPFAVARSVVDKHGGKIELDEHGTTITIMIPIGTAQRAAA